MISRNKAKEMVNVLAKKQRLLKIVKQMYDKKIYSTNPKLKIKENTQMLNLLNTILNLYNKESNHNAKDNDASNNVKTKAKDVSEEINRSIMLYKQNLYL